MHLLLIYTCLNYAIDIPDFYKQSIMVLKREITKNRNKLEINMVDESGITRKTTSCVLKFF